MSDPVQRPPRAVQGHEPTRSGGARHIFTVVHLPGWRRAVVESGLLAGAWMAGKDFLRVALTLTGFFGLFLLAGQPDNSYWGLLITPDSTPGRTAMGRTMTRRTRRAVLTLPLSAAEGG